MVLEHDYITRPELFQHQNYYKKQITNFYFIFVKFSYKQQREEQLYFAGNMADAEMSAKEEHDPENPLNCEEGKLRDGEIWVDLNNNQDNKSKLQRTIKELRSELRKFKEDNERILKAREELNAIMLSTIHNNKK